ncbi:MAG: DEAD/DEAH box helicase [Verrucomicrobiota bacterium]
MRIEKKTYGSFSYIPEFQGKMARWSISGSAFMLSKLKSLFDRPRRAGDFNLDATPANSEELQWFMTRYPLEGSREDFANLAELAQSAIDSKQQIQSIIDGRSPANARLIKTLLPLREYQARAVDVLALRNRLLVGDDVGLGKTAIALGAHSAGMGPTIVVCQTHLQEQWKREAEKFLFGVEVHIVKSRKQYDLPSHDFLIVPYSKVATWGDRLSELGYGLLVFDEAQELRRADSAKSRSCKVLSKSVQRALGLTATPIYNYGEEIYHVGSAIDQHCLGSYEEFTREWCTGIFGNHWAVSEPQVLHDYLTNELGFFLRRRRRDVERELPSIIKVVETVDADSKALADISGDLVRLAETVVQSSEFVERGQAARELDMKLRQATGIAKAPAVGKAVLDRVAAGDQVLLGGWHRAVYDIWEAMFQEAGISYSLYTGSESANKKQQSVDEFISGQSRVLILSLRSGAGLNGLQDVSSLVMFGELDWSPQVHDQFIGRLNRDGQQSAVTAMYLVSDQGSDPLIARVLGIKREQSEGIIDGESGEEDIDQQGRGQAIANSILKKEAA